MLGVSAILIGLTFFALSGSDSSPGVNTLTLRFAWQYDDYDYFRLLPRIERERQQRNAAASAKRDARDTARRSVEKMNEFLVISSNRWGLNTGSHVSFSISEEPVSIRGFASPMGKAFEIERNRNYEFGIMILTNYADSNGLLGSADGAAREGTIHFWMYSESTSNDSRPGSDVTLSHELGHLGYYRAPEGMNFDGDPTHHRSRNNVMFPGKNLSVTPEIDKSWAGAISGLFAKYGR